MSRKPSRLELRKRELVGVRHFVYRCYDSDGVIVYVGCTYDVAKTWAHHRSTRIGKSTARMRVTVHPDQPTAREVERSLIEKHEPPLNGQTYFMRLDRWPRLRLLQRLWDDMSEIRRVPSDDDRASTIGHLRNKYMARFGSDPIHEVAEVHEWTETFVIDDVEFSVVKRDFVRMRPYPTDLPARRSAA